MFLPIMVIDNGWVTRTSDLNHILLSKQIYCFRPPRLIFRDLDKSLLFQQHSGYDDAWQILAVSTVFCFKRYIFRNLHQHRVDLVRILRYIFLKCPHFCVDHNSDVKYKMSK